MPSFAEIQRYFAGVWRMMMGRSEGLRLLDLSADGFWNSFFAILVAFPPMVVGWVAISNELAGIEIFTSRFSLFTRLMLTDLATWILPYAILALAARPAGIADRFVHYVVANNWASALFAWITLPAMLMRLLFPEAADLANLVTFLIFLATMVLSWRLTNVAIGKGPAVATAVFGAMFAASLAILFTFEGLLSLSRAG
ncbi:MAG: transporter [Nitratireductor sp.]|uniref:transporter n=1 Tax=Nitratireductor sp. B36 TaxID=2762059 RepID=UPI000C905A78|nr:transporter [Nitratireductor sp. B36]MAS14268.1 transporter [Nitratireductor sp.]MCC5778536.1 transporter [Nitratireductor sp. B36]